MALQFIISNMYKRLILKVCEMFGKKISSEGLYVVGRSRGFLIGTKGNNTERGQYVFDKIKFMEWLEDCTEPIPSGYTNCSDLVRQYGVSRYVVQRILNKYNVEYVVRGSKKSKYYNNEEFDRYFRADSKCNKGEKSNG